MAVLMASGAPRAQGYAQGRALRSDVRATLALWRRALGRWRWSEALRAARRGTGREIARFLPQQHERLQGLALAAGVPVAALVWLECSERMRLRALAAGPTLVAEPAFADDWILRRSDPDAGGFASVEVSAPALAGCVAGLNRAGVAVVCAEDGPGLRLLAQDALLRASRLEAAVEHVRRRAPYLRQDGTLLAVDARGEPLEVSMCAGAVEVRAAASAADAERALRLDAAAGVLEWRGVRYAP